MKLCDSVISATEGTAGAFEIGVRHMNMASVYIPYTCEVHSSLANLISFLLSMPKPCAQEEIRALWLVGFSVQGANEAPTPNTVAIRLVPSPLRGRAPYFARHI